ncbi:MAG: signal recognition particle receptor subunit alpha [Candidatus Woesearchaeota archaeon]|nr:signal recognition particle receptor subunit alpha [Candidatus Woesearchaeota archaeon]
MVLEKLGESLKATLAKIASAVFVDDTLVLELVKDIQRALLSADVNVKLVLQLTEKIKKRAKQEELPPGLTKKEQLVHIVYDELALFLGGERKELQAQEQTKIMLVGLYGSGKTTTCGKLAKYFMKRGKKVALLGLDVHRPAAMKQLEQVGAGVHVPVFIDLLLKEPVAIWKKYEKECAAYDVLIIDTAGRDAMSQELLEELRAVGEAIKVDECLLVISADIGQTAQAQATAFHEVAGITGVIVTKMDGTAKGGGALGACSISNAPILFIGTGEKADDFEPFNPKGFVGRLLGMGDIEALLEKANDAITKEDAQDLEKKLMKGEFNLIDLYNQMKAMQSMGSLGKIMELIPGMGQLKLPKEALATQEGKLELWKHAMNSMTKTELEDPDIIDMNRMERIAKGSGVSASNIRELLKQYRQGKKMMKMFKGTDPEKMMEKIQKGQKIRGR